jgi:hypothetical protein
MIESVDLTVFWAVVAARLFLPLLIPRFPLPGILACLVLDGADYIIFQFFPPPLANYQGFDKALDIHYLAIAYISTLRNWTDFFAFRLSRFLFYYSLVGVALFELTQWRPLLLILPNTFEYFFIFYETVRIGWSPQRLTRRQLLGVVALIWLVIKLPQEYFIHIAQVDLTIVFAEWWETQAWIFAVMAVASVAIVALAWGWLKRRLPPLDHPLSFSADKKVDGFTKQQIRQAMRKWAFRIFDRDLLEKVALVALVTTIFTQVLPGAESDTLQIAVGVAIVTMVNTMLSHWLARRGYGLPDTLLEFVVVAAVNLVVLLIYNAVISGADDLTNTIFFVLLLTLIVTLFDRFQQVFFMRFPRRTTG